MISQHPDKLWNWTILYQTTFEKEKQHYIEKEMRRYLAAYKIQQWWYKVTLSPEYVVGRKFINRKYDKIFE